MNIKSYKYPLLNSKDWLYQKYIKEKLSTKKICDLIGAKTPNSVRQSLLRHNINVRSIGDGLRVNKDDGLIINKEIIDGCLLGDAFLYKWNKESKNSYPYFSKRNKYYDHIKFVAKILFSEKWEERIKESTEESLKKKQIVFTLRSLSNKNLLSYYERWYPKNNNYKKIIPEDIKITPNLLLHWFLDDGNSYHRRKNSKVKQIVITFCSECFRKTNQQMLINKINKCFDLNCKLIKVNYGKRWRIQLLQSKSPLFYDIIGNCPVPSMEYKWK